ncbi:MAG: hypothetical protein M3430_04340 [Acidobacteriota bacterium]|nr:hypothetical protein [Acidobacteriota bacterium]
MKKSLIKLTVCLILFFQLGSNALAQQVSTKVAYKLDEYGLLQSNCDYGARLDNFAIYLENNPTLKGYVITYGPEGNGSGTGNYLLRVTKDYLVQVRGIDEGRIKIIYGGRYKTQSESATEVWLVPHGAVPPKSVKYGNDVISFRGKFIEYEAWDGFYDGDPNGISPGRVRHAAFADMLKQQKKTRAYIVAYNGNDATPGAWRRVAQRDSQNLQDYGVETSRIKIIYGGYAGETKVQFWILPKIAPPPVKEAPPERAPGRAVRIGSFSDYQLTDTRDEQWVFKGFAEVLSNNEQLSACVIIRPRTDGADQSVDSDESQKVDLLKLVEKWKADLSKLYKIQENRFHLMVIPAQEEWDEGTFETWIVPLGAALPNPFVVETEEEHKDNQN